jgi:D-alanyl-D-alanine carboxypeptidase
VSPIGRRRLVAALLVTAVAAGSATLTSVAAPNPAVPPPTPVPPRGSLSPFPTALTTPANELRAPVIGARSALLADLATGTSMDAKSPDLRVPIASLTKIMTALVVTERTRPGEFVRITRDALRYRGSGVGVLPRGKRVRLEALLNGMLIVSGNDAAIALADHVAGSQRRFVRLMNAKAGELGLRCTRFADVYGLSPHSRSCARDLAVLTRLAMTRRRIIRIASRNQVALRFPIKGGRLFLTGHNPLYREHYLGAIGLKTGFTDEAGRCFVGVARRHGRELAVILLHSPNPYRHAPALLDAGFRSAR